MKLKTLCLKGSFLIFLFWSSLLYAETTSILQKNRKIYLNVYYKEAKPNDTLTVSVDNTLMTMSSNLKNKHSSLGDNEGCFRFEIPVEKAYGLFSLSKVKTINDVDDGFRLVKMIKPQLWEVGDSINLYISFKETVLGGDSDCKFSGIGAEKYKIANELEIESIKMVDSEIREKKALFWPTNWKGDILDYRNFDSISSNKRTLLKMLDSHKNELSEVSYNIIKADIIYEGAAAMLSYISAFVFEGGLNKLDEETKKNIINWLNFSFDYPNNYGLDSSVLYNSTAFITFLNFKMEAASYLHTGRYSSEWMYNAIKEYDVSSEVKEILLMRLFLRPVFNSENPSAIYSDAERFISNPEYVELLKELEIRVPGRKFTEFALEDVGGRTISLSDFKNKVVLIDFWFTGCGHCEDFYRETLSKVEKSLKNNGDVIFLSISIDRDKITWLKSVRGGTYTSEDAVNLYTNGLRNKHPVIVENNINGYPCTVLLNRLGEIKYFNSWQLYKEDSLIKAIHDLL